MTPAEAVLAALLAVLLVLVLCLAVLVGPPAGTEDRAAGPRVVSSAAAGTEDSPAQAPSAAAEHVEVDDDLPATELSVARVAPLRTGCPATSCSAASLPVAVAASLPAPD